MKKVMFSSHLAAVAPSAEEDGNDDHGCGISVSSSGLDGIGENIESAVSDDDDEIDDIDMDEEEEEIETEDDEGSVLETYRGDENVEDEYPSTAVSKILESRSVEVTVAAVPAAIASIAPKTSSIDHPSEVTAEEEGSAHDYRRYDDGDEDSTCCSRVGSKYQATLPSFPANSVILPPAAKDGCVRLHDPSLSGHDNGGRYRLRDYLKFCREITIQSSTFGRQRHPTTFSDSWKRAGWGGGGGGVATAARSDFLRGRKRKRPLMSKGGEGGTAVVEKGGASTVEKDKPLYRNNNAGIDSKFSWHIDDFKISTAAPSSVVCDTPISFLAAAVAVKSSPSLDFPSNLKRIKSHMASSWTVDPCAGLVPIEDEERHLTFLEQICHGDIERATLLISSGFSFGKGLNFLGTILQ